jgi:hypothetical protein
LTQRASIPPWTRAEIPAHASLVTDDSRFDGERALTDFCGGLPHDEIAGAC